MNYTIFKYSLPVALFVIYLLTIYASAMAQTGSSTPESSPETATTSPDAAATTTEVSPVVSIIVPSGDPGAKIVLKPGDQFAVQLSAPGLGFTDVSVNYDELGIGLVTVPDSTDGVFTTQMRGLPFISTGTKHYTVMFKDSLGNLDEITKTVDVDATKPTGNLVAAFTKASGSMSVHLSGNIDGTGSSIEITKAYVYGIDGDGAHHAGTQSDTIPTVSGNLSPIDIDIPIPAPDDTWVKIGYSLVLKDAAGNTAVISSDPTPIANIVGTPLIDHTAGGSIVEPVPYGGVPAGVGIPHTLINSIPEGDYYAVVFFEGLKGCPTDNYVFTSFLRDEVWGIDQVQDGYHKAHSTSAGGCMQMYHIDPNKGDPWLWGALDPESSTSVIADADGIPAFAICDDAATCDAIAPRDAASGPSGSGDGSLGVSSVMFLPGIKGSRLYENNPLCLIPSDDCNIPLWLPLGDAATPELFMDGSGKSTRRAYVREGDILDSAYGQHFYDAFFEKMDQAEENHLYGATWRWKPIAYDWRMSLPDIVNNGAQYGNRIYYEDATSTPYIEQSLRALAASSPTGKVTIIAHSNGGLVAKELLEKLGDAEASRLVDTVIMVGVPQSGAPRALGALLYGDAEGIPAVGRFAGLIISAAHAREFALNSPMAYHLLPSATYVNIKNGSYPLVKFEDGALLARQHALYGDTIDTDDELQEYLLGDGGARSAPDASDLSQAAVANASLLADAASVHESLDAWNPPAGIQVYQIGGYGVDTISGIDMREVPAKDGTEQLSYLPLFTQDGDGTVPSISSLMMNSVGNVHGLSVDMNRLSTGGSYSHGTMLEVPDVEEAIDTVLQARLGVHPASLYAAPMDEDPSMETQKRISFFIHSPASLTVTDSSGKETHVHADGTIAQDIPGSQSGTFGDVEYVTLPADGSYSVSIADISSATVTLDMQDRDGADVTATSTIAGIPATASSVVTMTVQNSIGSTSPVQVDEDGDGAADLSIIPIIGKAIVSPDVPAQSAATSSVSSVRTVVVEHVKKVLSLVRDLAQPLGFSTVRPAASSSAAAAPLPPANPSAGGTEQHITAASAPQASSSAGIQEMPGGDAAIVTAPDHALPIREEKLSWWRRLMRAIGRLFRYILSLLRITGR